MDMSGLLKNGNAKSQTYHGGTETRRTAGRLPKLPKLKGKSLYRGLTRMIADKERAKIDHGGTENSGKIAKIAGIEKAKACTADQRG
jgi:hypothetical protein